MAFQIHIRYVLTSDIEECSSGGCEIYPVEPEEVVLIKDSFVDTIF